MSNPPPSQPKTPRLSPALVGAGVLVMLLGFGLPLLTPKTAPDEAPREPAAQPLAPPPVQPATGLVGPLLKLVVGLAIVCGLCVLAAKYIGPKSPPAPGLMTVDASLAVGPCIVHLVRAGHRRLLIGTDAAGVKAVLELPGAPPALPPEEQAAPEGEAAAESEPEPDAAAQTQQKLLALLLQLRSHKAATPPP